MSLYADYLRERTNDYIIESPDGFITYRFIGDKSIYIVDIFVIPEKRKQGVASDLADSVLGMAKARGCVEMFGTVNPQTKGATTSLKVLLGYGMQLHGIDNGLIVFRKEI